MGDEINAFVYSYDAGGDNGSPLLTLSLDGPSARGGRGGQPRHRRASNLAEDSARDVDRELGESCSASGSCIATAVVAGRADAMETMTSSSSFSFSFSR